ncbi:MAG: hypothetical protein HY770_03840 [Chitinivibrionia bacterium]|nr:hypothetical protein [Chitinivibrionia bacterium]
MDNSGSSWIVPDHPTKVFVNMKSGLESLTGSNYEKSLNTGFLFVALPADENQFPALVGWTRANELEVLSNIIGDASKITCEFTGLTPKQQDISFAQYEGSYNLTIINKAPQDTTVYRAKALFDLREGSKGWELVKWEDTITSPGYATWGFLRGLLSN